MTDVICPKKPHSLDYGNNSFSFNDSFDYDHEQDIIKDDPNPYANSIFNPKTAPLYLIVLLPIIRHAPHVQLGQVDPNCKQTAVKEQLTIFQKM